MESIEVASLGSVQLWKCVESIEVASFGMILTNVLIRQRYRLMLIEEIHQQKHWVSVWREYLACR